MRSRTPRRRRREAARRAANRARWTVRRTPSRAPPLGTRTSSTRTFPPAPWNRRPAHPTEEEEEVCVEEPSDEIARSSTDAARAPGSGGDLIPGLSNLDPRIRWWSDILGLTNPMNATEHVNVLSPNTTSTIVSNLQGQGDIERARNVQSLLSFLGLLIAELLRAVYDAENGEPVVLMQSSLSVGPGSFAKVLSELQEDLEQIGKARAKKVSRHLLQHLEKIGMQSGTLRSRDRKLRLTALLVAYDEGEAEDPGQALCEESGYEWEPSWLWARVEPYLGEEADSSGPHGGARGSAGALREDDEKEGILVRRTPRGARETPARREVQEVMQHDAEIRQKTNSRKKTT